MPKVPRTFAESIDYRLDRAEDALNSVVQPAQRLLGARGVGAVLEQLAIIEDAMGQIRDMVDTAAAKDEEVG